MLSLRTYCLQFPDVPASSPAGPWRVSFDLSVAMPASEEHIRRAAERFLHDSDAELRQALAAEVEHALRSAPIGIPDPPLPAAASWALGLLHHLDQALAPVGHAVLQLEAHAAPAPGVPGSGFHGLAQHPQWSAGGGDEGPAEESPPDRLSVVLCTAPDVETGARIGRALVEERLAACVNVVPGVRSVYEWQGKLCDEAEALLVIKTAADRFRDLMARLKGLHPYTTPEILALQPVDGWPAYAGWVIGNTRPRVATDRP